MPHVIVKLWPGKSEQEKVRLARKITEDIMDSLDVSEDTVSVAFEEVDSTDWAEKVYQSDIVRNSHKLYKKPGYSM
jgi:4-oxalocrotonate tautomerase